MVLCYLLLLLLIRIIWLMWVVWFWYLYLWIVGFWFACGGAIFFPFWIGVLELLQKLRHLSEKFRIFQLGFAVSAPSKLFYMRYGSFSEISSDFTSSLLYARLLLCTLNIDKKITWWPLGRKIEKNFFYALGNWIKCLIS